MNKVILYFKKLLVYEWTRGIKEEEEEEESERERWKNWLFGCLVYLNYFFTCGQSSISANQSYHRLVILSTLLWMNFIWVAAIVHNLKASQHHLMLVITTYYQITMNECIFIYFSVSFSNLIYFLLFLLYDSSE